MGSLYLFYTQKLMFSLAGLLLETKQKFYGEELNIKPVSMINMTRSFENGVSSNSRL